MIDIPKSTVLVHGVVFNGSFPFVDSFITPLVTGSVFHSELANIRSLVIDTPCPPGITPIEPEGCAGCTLSVSRRIQAPLWCGDTAAYPRWSEQGMP